MCRALHELALTLTRDLRRGGERQMWGRLQRDAHELADATGFPALPFLWRKLVMAMPQEEHADRQAWLQVAEEFLARSQALRGRVSGLRLSVPHLNS